MSKIKTIINLYLADEKGATAIEYGLIAALIGIGIVVGATAMGSSISSLFGDVDGDIGRAFSP
jgi:pilus assembly protein Flp/PilA